MGKKYLFNNGVYTNLNDLALAYSNNYYLAVEDVKENYKKLFKFVKSVRKKMYKDTLDIFYNSKYSSTVVTLLIHLFSIDNIVNINGKNLTFEDFTRTYSNNKTLYNSFIEDYGLDKTFATHPECIKLKQNVGYIRRHIDDEFIETYITNYYKYDGLEDITPYLTFSNNHDLFKKYNEVFKKLEFQLILSQKFGINHVLKIRNEENYPAFYGLKLVNEYFNEEEIISILNTSHNMWLLANLDKYSYKSKAKDTYEKLKEIIKVYQKALKDKDITKPIDVASKVGDLYLEFVNCYSEGLITVKKNTDKELYELNIKYCDTYVAKCYLLGVNSDDVDNNISEIEQISSKKKQVINFNSKRERKRVNKLSRFKNSVVFFNLLAILFLIMVIVTTVIDKQIFDLPLIDSTLDYIFIGTLVLNLIICSILNIKINNYRKSYLKVVRLRNLYKEELEVKNKENEIIKLESKDKRNVNRAKRSARITTSLSQSLLAFIYSFIIVCLFNNILLETVNGYIDWQSAYEAQPILYFVIIGPSLAFLYGLLRKKKGFFTVIFTIVLALIGVILPVFIF